MPLPTIDNTEPVEAPTTDPPESTQETRTLAEEMAEMLRLTRLVWVRVVRPKSVWEWLRDPIV